LLQTNSARTEAKLDSASKVLADAITLLGVNVVLDILLKKKPNDTFKILYKVISMPTYSSAIAAKMNVPNNRR